MRTGLAAAGGIGLLATALWLQPAAAEPSASASGVTPEAAAENLTLLSTTIVQGDLKGKNVFPQHAATFAQKTITCPNGGPACRVEALMNVLIDGRPESNNTKRFGMHLVVDGNAAFPENRKIDGALGQNETILNLAQGLKPGTHTVAVVVAAEARIQLYDFAVSYHVYR